MSCRSSWIGMDLGVLRAAPKSLLGWRRAKRLDGVPPSGQMPPLMGKLSLGFPS